MVVENAVRVGDQPTEKWSSLRHRLKGSREFYYRIQVKIVSKRMFWSYKDARWSQRFDPLRRARSLTTASAPSTPAWRAIRSSFGNPWRRRTDPPSFTALPHFARNGLAVAWQQSPQASGALPSRPSSRLKSHAEGRTTSLGTDRPKSSLATIPSAVCFFRPVKTSST